MGADREAALAKIASVFFVYMLFWSLAAFLVLPFGVRTAHDEASHDEDGKKGGGPAVVPGQERGAPSNFSGRRFVWRTTLVATIGYVLFYANYIEGWVTLDDVSLIHPPASVAKGY